jgi:hypothetical protein
MRKPVDGEVWTTKRDLFLVTDGQCGTAWLDAFPPGELISKGAIVLVVAANVSKVIKQLARGSGRKPSSPITYTETQTYAHQCLCCGIVIYIDAVDIAKGWVAPMNRLGK